MKNKWIVEVVLVLAIFLFLCLIATAFVESLAQENTCWRNGYARPVTYDGEHWYCFGRDGRPDLVALDTLQESR